jgi:hypothetical protein
MRLPPSQPTKEEVAETADTGTSSVEFNTDELREAFLVRRARDSQPSSSSGKSSGGRFASGMWSSMGIGGGNQSQRMGGAAVGAQGTG